MQIIYDAVDGLTVDTKKHPKLYSTRYDPGGHGQPAWERYSYLDTKPTDNDPNTGIGLTVTEYKGSGVADCSLHYGGEKYHICAIGESDDGYIILLCHGDIKLHVGVSD